MKAELELLPKVVDRGGMKKTAYPIRVDHAHPGGSRVAGAATALKVMEKAGAGGDKAYADFRHRDLSGREYVYVWVDGVHFNIRLEDDRLCTLVMIGVLPNGEKELLAVEDGYRESAESWQARLRALQRCGMAAPALAVGDGALGFWATAREVWPVTRAQACWRHKLANVLDKLPLVARRPLPGVGAGACGATRGAHDYVKAKT